jgi:hypothetical protein
MEVADQEVTVAVVVPNFTVLVPWAEPKLVPVIVTDVPGVPDVGLSEVMLGVVEALIVITTSVMEFAGKLMVKLLLSPEIELCATELLPWP